MTSPSDSPLATDHRGHTPGPWHVIFTSGDPKGVHVTANYLGGETVAVLGSELQTLESLHANARLIAAAPELLAACRRLRAVINDHVSLADVDALDTAIAKAEGKL